MSIRKSVTEVQSFLSANSHLLGPVQNLALGWRSKTDLGIFFAAEF
jgi:hypothetical protein